jgi:hypothetical protein
MAKKRRGTKAKFDPLDFPFGYNVKPKRAKGAKGKARKSDAWRAYVGGAKRRR